MSVVEYTINGEKFYTHTSWFSEKQWNAWSSIPVENRNLALYYSLATVSLVGVFFRRNPLVSSFFQSYGKFITGAGLSVVGSYGVWFALLKSQESSEIERVVSRNENTITPLWKRQDSVVDLRAKDYTTFLNRRNGQRFARKDVTSYNPDSVLERADGANKVEKLQ